ncbi:transcription termination factor 4, mitochondrial [Gracilinanus agilis]|uniref:transcription termination factor 4, mitochondrial n=1 Tax=Gracilinanus agilis TaxID=191870 RepID=UPI001CFCD2C2|nr:transcription termination factor 4, mitochondrial [Gracilinanus agilis]
MAAACRQVLRWPQLALSRAPGRPLTTASPRGGREEVQNPATSESPAEGQQEAEARRWLLDAGFDPTQTAQLLSAQRGVRPPKVWAVVSELLLLGLSPGPVCEAVQRNPGILRLSGAQLKSRASRLRKLGLGAGNLQHVSHCCPDVFTMSPGRIEGLVSLLRDKCLFSGQQVTEILHTCPRVLHEEPEALEYKFQYAYFRMGIKQQDLVKTKYFQYSMTKIKQRHVFLERLGLYQTPDKKGQTQICNPSLNSILRVPEAEFLAKTARSSSEEFQVFKKLLAREEAEEGEGSSSEEEDSDPEDTDSSGDEED